MFSTYVTFRYSSRLMHNPHIWCRPRRINCKLVYHPGHVFFIVDMPNSCHALVHILVSRSMSWAPARFPSLFCRDMCILYTSYPGFYFQEPALYLPNDSYWFSTTNFTYTHFYSYFFSALIISWEFFIKYKRHFLD